MRARDMVRIHWIGILDGAALLVLYLVWRWHVISQRVLLSSLLAIGTVSTVLIFRSFGLVWQDIAILYTLLGVSGLGIWIGSRIGHKG